MLILGPFPWDKASKEALRATNELRPRIHFGGMNGFEPRDRGYERRSAPRPSTQEAGLSDFEGGAQRRERMQPDEASDGRTRAHPVA